MSRALWLPFPWLVLALLAVPLPVHAEGELAAPGECARAPELPPPGPARASLAGLFPPVDVGSGAGPGAGNLQAGERGIADLRSGARPGACDDPGSGCAGPLRDAPAVPPGGTLLPDGWIRFPDGSLLPPQRSTPAPLQAPAPPAGAP